MNELLAHCAFVFRVGQSWVTNPHGRIICILSDKLEDKKMSRQCTHSFYLHKKKKGQRTLWPGPQCVPFPVYDYILFESKRSSSFSVAWHSFLCRHHCPQWTGVTLWLLAVMLLFFSPNCTFILYLFLTLLVVKHWWWQANVRSESYFSFPPPHIVTLPPVSIFIFQNVLPLVLYLPPFHPRPPPPLMSFPTSFLPQRLSHSTSTLFLCGFQPSK